MPNTIVFDLGGVYFGDGTRIAADTISAEYKIERDAVEAMLKGWPTWMKNIFFCKNLRMASSLTWLNAKKPDPIIYQLLLDRASHPASACVYIDDKPEYLGPAKSLGMQAIAFKNVSQLAADLKELALLPDEDYR